MPILKLLSDLVFGVPCEIGRQVLEEIRAEVNRQRLVTEASIKERLGDLQQLVEAGEISEAEYEELESQLMERLRAVRAYRRSQNEEEGT